MAAALPIEREQEFTYYWYAAKEALDNEDWSRALMLLRHCEQLDPNDGKTLTYTGVLYSAAQQDSLTHQYLERAYKSDPTLWRPYAKYLLSHSNNDKKTIRRAIRVVESAAKREPKEADIWETLVRLYTGTEQYCKALRAQDKLEEITGYDAYAAIARYRIYAAKKDNRKAIAEIDRYLKVDPTNLRFWFFKLELQEYIQASWQELADTYQHILSLDNTQLMILNNYAYLLATHGGDLREAERYSQRTIQAEPTNPVYLDTYAWILHLEGQHTLAAFYIKQAASYLQAQEGEEDSSSNKSEIEEHYKAIMEAIAEAEKTMWHTRQASNARATLTIGEQTINASVTILAVRDSIVIVKVMPILGIELFRLTATPEHIEIQDRSAQSSESYTYARLAAIVEPRISYADIERMACGEKGETRTFTYTAWGERVSLTITYPEPRINTKLNLR